MPTQSFWTPTRPSKSRIITTAELVEGDSFDLVTLYIQGEPLPQLKLARGLGVAFLAECGLSRQP